MTAQRLTLAGWLAITNAVLTIPIFVLSVFLGTKSGGGVKLAEVLLTLVSLAIFIFIFSSLKNLLNTRFNFRDTDIFISVLIWANGALALIDVFGTLFPKLETVVGVVLLVLIVPFGIVSIVFATKLLRLQDTLHDMQKPFAYTCMATGFCYATIVLIPVALLASAIADIILGIIFIRAAERSTEAAT